MPRVDSTSGACTLSTSTDAHNVVEIVDLFDSELRRFPVRQERVVHGDLKCVRSEQLDHVPADERRADEPDAFAEVADTGGVERDGRGRIAQPLPEQERTLVRQQDHGDRVLRDGDRVGRGRRGHGDAAVPDRVGDLPLDRSRRVREEGEMRGAVQRVGRQSRTAPMPDEHVGAAQHRDRTVVVEPSQWRTVGELTGGDQPREVSIGERMVDEPFEHRQRDDRPLHDGWRAARFAAASARRSGRAL